MSRIRPNSLLAGALAALAALVALAAVPAPASAQARAVAFADTARPVSAPAHRTDVVTLGAGDLVRITVWRKPELSGEFAVLADGSIAHPLFRGLRLGGVPLEDAEEQLRVFLTRLEKNPQFVLEPLIRVAVSGEVVRPNVYPLRPETSVAMAVALAGGATERGRRDRVRLLRGDREVLIDLAHPDKGLARMTIRSGDQIVIERRRAVFREYIAPGITVAGATAAILNVVLRYRE
jgi:protein involved in polysaccharide export with SLBB domain